MSPRPKWLPPQSGSTCEATCSRFLRALGGGRGDNPGIRVRVSSGGVQRERRIRLNQATAKCLRCASQALVPRVLPVLEIPQGPFDNHLHRGLRQRFMRERRGFPSNFFDLRRGAPAPGFRSYRDGGSWKGFPEPPEVGPYLEPSNPREVRMLWLAFPPAAPDTCLQLHRHLLEHGLRARWILWNPEHRSAWFPLNGEHTARGAWSHRRFLGQRVPGSDLQLTEDVEQQGAIPPGLRCEVGGRVVYARALYDDGAGPLSVSGRR